jgi:hypothetical protein
LPPLGVLDAVFDGIIDESADDAALPMSAAELAAGMAAVLESGAAVESAAVALLAGCEQPARAKPAIAARMATVETSGVR